MKKWKSDDRMIKKWWKNVPKQWWKKDKNYEKMEKEENGGCKV